MSHSRRTYTVAFSVLFAFIALLTTARLSLSDLPGGEAEYTPGQLLVAFDPTATYTERVMARATADAVVAREFQSGLELWEVDPNTDIPSASEELKAQKGVLIAEPNYYFIPTTSCPPNDAYFDEQWAHLNTGQIGGTEDADIDSDIAWCEQAGSADIIVAIMGTGVDFDHPDLHANMWVNASEAAGDPNVDDDQNGYVDDVYGYDFIDDDGNPSPYTNPIGGCQAHPSKHETWVAGVAGAVGNNNIGVAGTAHQVSMMALRTYNTATAIEATEYAVDNGAAIINMSFSYPPQVPSSSAFSNVLKWAGDRDVLVTVSAGNEGDDLDQEPKYPASYNWPNIITVGATDANDRLAVFDSGSSNYGASTVDVGAPGKYIYTTMPLYNASGDSCDPDPNEDLDPYEAFEGTSAAAPFVAGVAALIKSFTPTMAVEVLRARILEGVDYNPDFGGRLNSAASIGGYEDDAPPQITDLHKSAGTTSSLTMAWTATSDDPNSSFPVKSYQLRYSLSGITSENWLDATPVAGMPSPSNPSTTDSKTVDNLTCGTTYHFILRASDDWGNGPLSNEATATTNSRICQESYCAAEELRCTYTGRCGSGNCCEYDCTYDESCSGADTCPSGACNCQ